MAKRRKNYPMDGPNLAIQKLMEHPRRNRAALVRYFKDRPEMRPETRNVIYLK